jgi:hypothetical protein
VTEKSNSLDYKTKYTILDNGERKDFYKLSDVFNWIKNLYQYQYKELYVESYISNIEIGNTSQEYKEKINIIKSERKSLYNLQMNNISQKTLSIDDFIERQREILFLRKKIVINDLQSEIMQLEIQIYKIQKFLDYSNTNILQMFNKKRSLNYLYEEKQKELEEIIYLRNRRNKLLDDNIQISNVINNIKGPTKLSETIERNNLNEKHKKNIREIDRLENMLDLKDLKLLKRDLVDPSILEEEIRYREEKEMLFNTETDLKSNALKIHFLNTNIKSIKDKEYLSSTKKNNNVKK